MATRSFILASKLLELLRAADTQGKNYVWIMSNDRLGIGVEQFQPTKIIRLSKERMEEFAEDTQSPHAAPTSAPNVPAALAPTSAKPPARVNGGKGKYWFELFGQRSECASLKDVLAGTLRGLERERTGTLEKLSEIKGERGKIVIAKDRRALFETQELVDKSSVWLEGEWWFGKNNSRPETVKWLKRACNCAGVKWGEEFKTSLTEPTSEDRSRLKELGFD